MRMRAAAIIAGVAWTVTLVLNTMLLATVYQVFHVFHWTATVWLVVPAVMAGLSIVLPFRLRRAGRQRPALIVAVVSLIVSLPALAYCVRLWGA
jgi:hypothetical protein